MTNTNKKGYSTTEVAQIIGCTPCTVRNMIANKKLGAYITKPDKPNGYNTIRVGREHIQEFIKNNPYRFTDADRNAWGVGDTKPELGASIDDLPNKPTGAWASIVDMEKDLDLHPVENLPWLENKQEETNTISHYSVLINGRIAVAGVTKETAITIVTALINDTGKAVFNDITIKVMK
jgi:hypothetical protein